MVAITIYFNTGRKCTSGWTAPPYWTANTTYGSSDEWRAGVKPTTANGHNYLCTTPGTTGNDDPFDNGQTDEIWDEIHDGTVVWTCFDPFTNPTVITSKPFGHGFTGSLWYGRFHCVDDAHFTDDIDSTYLSGHTYNANSLSSQHEIAAIRYRIFGEDDLTVGYVYGVKEIWKKAGVEIFRNEYDLTWGDWAWYQTGGYIGWTPCWRWAYGDLYNGYEEIKENGSDYLARVELYYGDSLICASNDVDNGFTVENLQHTVIYWDHIKDITGAEIGGVFGMKASDYVYDWWTREWDWHWYRQKNKTNSDTLIVDGMEQYETISVELYAYRSGYVKSGRTCPDVTDKDINNGPYDFTGSDYLHASVEGSVQEGSDGIPNANVWGERSGAKYGCKTNADGMFALPLHTGGTYTIKAAKNNHDVVTSGTTITQSGDHPDTSVSQSFTLPRTTNYPQGEYAHLNSLAVDGQSVIIPDDPVTGDGDLIIT